MATGASALPERLDELRAAQEASKETPRYDQLCRSLSAEESDRRAAAGEEHVLRFRVPEGGDRGQGPGAR